MSLHALANHMAEKGRGPDTMLVHMAPSEVHGLQALAKAHGGSLTINPETGLPEAGFLDKLLPAIIGFGVTALSGGTIPGWQIALGVGGVEAARTGDLGKGIAAGLGAYGGAGLGESLATAGATQVAGDQLAQQALEQGATGTQQQIAQNIAQQNIAPANIAAAREATSTGDLLSKGFDVAKADPMKFAQANWKPMAAAALPVLSDIGTTTQMPGMSQAPGQVHRFSFDPYGQNYTSTGNYQVPVTGANGGLMGMANGGVAHFRAAGYVNDEQLQDQEFVPSPEDQPARVPTGGGALTTPLTVAQLMQPVGGQAVDAVDKTAAMTGGIGALAQNTGGGGSGFLSGVSQAVQNAAAANPNLFPNNTATAGGLDTIAANQAAAGNTTASTALNNAGVTTDNTGANVVTTAAAPAVDPAAAKAQVANIYRNVLGRDPDPAGLAYWSGQIASGKSPESVYQDILNSAKDYVGSGVVNQDQIKNLSFADATKAYTGYQSADTGNIVDEWIRNIIGREPTAADREQAWYKNAASNMSNPGAAADTYKQFQDYATAQAGTAANTRAAEALAALQQNGLTDADVFKATGMHTVDLVKVNPDLAQNLIGASQLKENQGIKALDIADYVGMDKLTGSQFSGLAKLTPDQQNQLAMAEAKKGITAGMSDAEIARAIDLKYLKGYTPADIQKIINDNHLRIINQPPNSTVIGGSGTDTITGGGGTDTKAVITDTGVILPVVKVPGTNVERVVNSTQVATTAVTAPTVLNEAARTALPVGVSGNQTATVNPNGTISMNTGTPNMPAGGYTGMQSLRDAYTKGGGSLGYAPVAPKTMAEFNQRYNTLTGGSKQAYDYLMGGEYSPTPYTKTGEVMKPYSEAVLGVPGDVSKKRYLFDPATRSYKANPDYVPITYDSKGNKIVGVSNKDVASYVNSNKDATTSDYQRWMADNNVSLEQIAGALGISLAEAKRRFGTGTTTTTADTTTTDKALNHRAAGGLMAGGGLAAMANGGYDLGSYSDGGRLLRGPGDGVSDSIPATIGKGRPARLADGEFVVPARIVSEIGNGSTEAGARKLYAMMDRVQAARRSSIGKGNVAKNSRADKYLPA